MKKLTLNVEDLDILSFETNPPETRMGTVRGYDFAWSDDSVCPGVTNAAGHCRPY